jgi:hypothetical protein
MEFATLKLGLVYLDSKSHLLPIITFIPLSYFINKKSTFCCIFEKSGAVTDERQEIATHGYQLDQFQSIISI